MSNSPGASVRTADQLRAEAFLAAEPGDCSFASEIERLAAEFKAVRAEEFAHGLRTVEAFRPLIAMTKALLDQTDETADGLLAIRKLRAAIRKQLAHIPDPGPVPEGVL